MCKIRVSPYTKLAIQMFQKRVRVERKLEQTTIELNGWVSKIPDGDMDYYIEKTEAIQKLEYEKLEKFMRRVGKKPWER